MGGLGDVKIIVVGAGFGGLTSAIELKRKGADVLVIESAKQLTEQGDTIQIASNAAIVMKSWGNVLQTIADESARPPILCCMDSNGNVLMNQKYDNYPNLYPSRGRAHRTIYEYAVSIGVKFRFGSRVYRYFEDDTQAGVYIGEEKVSADAVIAADGVHSKARNMITGKIEVPKSSGFAAYRTWFSYDHLKGSPLFDEILNAKEDIFWAWIGLDVHALVMTNIKMRYLAVFCTHKDTYTVEESWNFPGRKEDMLEVVKGWDERLTEVIKCIPPEALIDYKLLWRDPAPRWISEHGRVALVGDSAHPHIPSSGQGAAQAIEDGATIGAVLDRAGKENIQLGLRAYEKIRFWRTCLTQRMGWELRHAWHRTNWELAKKQPESLEMKQPFWLFGSDPEKYAYEAYDEVVECLKDGKQFVPKNIPEGYKHENWTMEDMMAAENGNLERIVV